MRARRAPSSSRSPTQQREARARRRRSADRHALRADPRIARASAWRPRRRRRPGTSSQCCRGRDDDLDRGARDERIADRAGAAAVAGDSAASRTAGIGIGELRDAVDSAALRRASASRPRAGRGADRRAPRATCVPAIAARERVELQRAHARMGRRASASSASTRRGARGARRRSRRRARRVGTRRPTRRARRSSAMRSGDARAASRSWRARGERGVVQRS